MILTDAEIRQIRRTIEDQAGMDEELLRRCGDLIHMENFDEAVRSACVLLEERLRKAAHKENLMGVRLAKYAFDPDTGTLAKHLADKKSEQEGLYYLFVGAFKLFRNPTAHGVVGYDAAEAKAIISFISLLLTFLNRIEDLPPPDSFPENLERALQVIEQKSGASVAGRLRVFAGKCKKLGLEIRPSKGWVPFKRHALTQTENWDKPKIHRMTLFYVIADEDLQGFRFPVNLYYTRVVGFDIDPVSEGLRDLGFVVQGKNRNHVFDFKDNNDQVFFDALYELVEQVCIELEETLQ